MQLNALPDDAVAVPLFRSPLRTFRGHCCSGCLLGALTGAGSEKGMPLTEASCAHFVPLVLVPLGH